VFTLWEWEQMGTVRNISRSLVPFTFLTPSSGRASSLSASGGTS
jgi:hypothetical protein